MSGSVSVADVLDRAADLIAELGWTQNVFARDKKGMPVSFNDMRTSCFCIRGALARVSSEYMSDRAEDVLEPLLPFDLEADDSGSKITRFNDAPGRTQAQVIAKLREAAALARKDAL